MATAVSHKPLPLPALRVAAYILALSRPDYGDIISNLKLQKLLYYAQGYHLALTGDPLYKEEVENWMHGPVVPVVYRAYKEYGNEAIPRPECLKADDFPVPSKRIINEVYKVLGQFSAWRLREMTHQEPPWRDTQRNEVITEDAMRDYFKTQIVTDTDG